MMTPFRVDPDWYERTWLTERPEPLWRTWLASTLDALLPPAPMSGRCMAEKEKMPARALPIGHLRSI